MKHVVVIGNGIAGITAARGIRKRSAHRITVVSAESDHFYSRTALMYIYMGHMRYADTKPYEDWFWAKNRIGLKRAFVERVNSEKRHLELQGGDRLPFDELIIASGSKWKSMGWPGQELMGVQGLYGLRDLESMQRFTRSIERAVVVGGGLIGVEMAEMLRSRGIETTFLVRESSWMEQHFPVQESAMINDTIRAHGVDLRLGTVLERIEGNGTGRVAAIRTSSGEDIPCQFVGLTIGVRPNIDFLRDSGIECATGVLVDAHLRTNVEGIYAVGDCAELRQAAPGRRAVEALWYIGRAMGEAVALTICGELTAYVQDIWFNSAKFFDLEWQVYGDVPACPPAAIESLFWANSQGTRAIRINFRRADEVVTGFSLLGIRYRHELCHEWLRANAPIREVLRGLGAANFDPELFAQYEGEIIAQYERRFPERPLSPPLRRGLASLWRLGGAS